MKCPRCLNEDPAYFYHGSSGWYCRKCISFGRAMLEESTAPVFLEPIAEQSEEYTLQYPLTKMQKQISDACLANITQTDVLLKCVCGAGKTDGTVFLILRCIKTMIT